jgi:hypothetical protein
MAAWKDVEQAVPEFAARVQRLFDAGRHKTIATLRADGSPRISGIECEFAAGEVRIGSMPGARKGADLRRDPRFALHGPTFHPEDGKEADWPGEAKIAGRAVLAGPVGDGTDGDLFLADICEVVITRLNPEATARAWTWSKPSGRFSPPPCSAISCGAIRPSTPLFRGRRRRSGRIPRARPR